jgi:hypothetical protein
MKTYLLLFTFFILINEDGISQAKHGKVWVSGAGISYKVKFEPTGIVNTYLDTFYSPFFNKGNSNICDTNGNLILCSDGYNIYDSNANYIDGGDTLVPKFLYIDNNGFSILSQSSIFLPMANNKYYFVTPTFTDSQYYQCHYNGGSCFFDLLLYSVIDMNANGGAGKVVKRMQVLMDSAVLSKTQMMACRHSNGKDWWLLKQGGSTNIVYKFLCTQDSIYDYGTQVFNTPAWGVWDIKGQSVFRKDGSQYATTVQGNSTGEVFIADFERCYGILTNPKVIIAPQGSQHNPFDTTIKERLPVGLAYSPNGQLLYVITMSNIYQYDLQDNTWYHVAGLDTSYQKFQDYNASYLGPDDKLYIGNFAGLSKQMSVINNPDIKGAGCNFCPRCFRVDSVFFYGAITTPPCMPNYGLGAQVCWPLANEEQILENEELVVFPNPTNLQLNIRYRNSNDSRLQIINMLGVLVKDIQLSRELQLVSVLINDLSPGVYSYRQVAGKQYINSGKLIIEN